MDIDSAVQAEVDKNDGVKPTKPPRKPRPSEIAAKLDKAKAPKPEKAAKKVRKPAATKKKAAKTKKPAKKAATAKKPRGAKSAKRAKRPKVMAAVARSERLDMRLTKDEKGKLATKAAKLRRTVTSIVLEAVEKIK